MRSWTDKNGREWPLEMTLGVVQRLKKKSDVNLLDPKKLAEYTGDELLLADLMLYVWQPRATELEVTDDEFYEQLDEGYEAARDVLIGELADFFQKRGKLALARLLRTAIQTTDAQQLKIDTRLNQSTVDRVLAKTHDRAFNQLETKLMEILGDESENSPPSPESAKTTSGA